MTLELLGIEAGGLDFAYLAAGPRGGPLALCLHGFPDTAHTYRRLLPGLAAAGFRAVAPFSRGYAPTGVPVVAPSGPNALIAGGNNFDEAPQTVVSAVNLGTGKLVATVKLPSDLPAAPAVTGSDAIYELNPEYCVHAGSAGPSNP
jgi:pimeloyl-ACP methyl ester carboxylesterase